MTRRYIHLGPAERMLHYEDDKVYRFCMENQVAFDTDGDCFFRGETHITGAVFDGYLDLSSTHPAVAFFDTDEAVDEKIYDVSTDGGVFMVRAINDAIDAATYVFRSERTGYNVDKVYLCQDKFSVDDEGNTVVSGTLTVGDYSLTANPCLTVKANPGSGGQIMIAYDASNDAFWRIDSGGQCIFQSSGAQLEFKTGDGTYTALQAVGAQVGIGGGTSGSWVLCANGTYPFLVRDGVGTVAAQIYGTGNAWFLGQMDIEGLLGVGGISSIRTQVQLPANSGVCSEGFMLVGYNAYYSGGAWKRLVADNDAIGLGFSAYGYMALFGNTDAYSTADSTITFADVVHWNKDGKMGIGVTPKASLEFDSDPGHCISGQNSLFVGYNYYYDASGNWRRTVADNDVVVMGFGIGGTVTIYTNTDGNSAVDSLITLNSRALFSKAGGLQLDDVLDIDGTGLNDFEGSLDIALNLEVHGAFQVKRYAGAGSVTIPHSFADVSNPPTQAQLNSAFGTPTGSQWGMLGVIDDNNSGTDVYFVFTASDGSSGFKWFYIQATVCPT